MSVYSTTFCVSKSVIVAAERPALQLPPRRAAQDDLKKPSISRAEGGPLQAPVGRQPDDGFLIG
jgi:hypothetical protein